MKRLALICVLVALVVPSTSHAAPNLLPNGDFERSALEPDPALQYAVPQPVLPEGWTFEGVAGLFDHSPNDFHSGQRSAAISIPASTNRTYCADGEDPSTCVDNPLNPIREAASPYYQVAPHWRNAVPVAVTAGAKYDLSFWSKQVIVTVGEGMISSVRWVDDLGVTVGVSSGPSRIQGENDPETLAWKEFSKRVTAPAGATGAIVLLGHTDDAWISQVLFDDASFTAV